MTGNYKYIALWLLCSLLIIACSKDGADGNDVYKPNEEAKEIGIMVNVSKMAEATRTTTYDGVSALQAEAHFTCTAYQAGTLTEYIPPSTTVDWNSTQWVFNNGNSHYYWPLPSTPGGTYPSLDFFGYMPKASNLSTDAPYISEIEYTAAHNVTFTCSGLPMTNAGQGSSLKEFVFGMALGKNYGNASGGVTLQFQHPFARIKLQLAASHPDITINSITFKSIKNNGSYNHNATPKWTPSGDADFVLTLTGAAAVFNDNTSERQIGDYYIMIPQEWAGEIVVNATWTDWGAQLAHTVSTTLPSSVTWQSGCNYTYTFTITETDLKVNSEKYTEQW